MSKGDSNIPMMAQSDDPRPQAFGRTLCGYQPRQLPKSPSAKIVSEWDAKLRVLLQEVAEETVQRIQMIRNQRLDNLERRVSRLESQLADTTTASRISPEMQWLSENNDWVVSQYSGEWIAIDEQGVRGNNVSLAELDKEMITKQLAESVTYVKVEKPTTKVRRLF